MNRQLLSLVLIGIGVVYLIVGCNGTSDKENTPPDPPTPEARWNSWLKLQEVTGRKVLSVTGSQQWINENRSRISMPTKLSFLEQHLVMEEPFLQQMTMITVDHNGKYRVVTKESTLPRVPDGFLDEEASKQWLSEKGYQVNPKSDVPIKKVRPGYRFAPRISRSATVLYGLPEGVTLLIQNGKIYIKMRRT